MPYMYILECSDGSYYTGSTWDLTKRLWEHQNGLGARHTAKHLPVKLVYCEPYERVEDAFRREKQVQGWSRRKKQALIEANKDNLIEYSKTYTQHGKPNEPSVSTSSTDAPPLGEHNELSGSTDSPDDTPLGEPVEPSEQNERLLP